MNSPSTGHDRKAAFDRLDRGIEARESERVQHELRTLHQSEEPRAVERRHERDAVGEPKAGLGIALLEPALELRVDLGVRRAEENESARHRAAVLSFTMKSTFQQATRHGRIREELVLFRDPVDFGHLGPVRDRLTIGRAAGSASIITGLPRITATTLSFRLIEIACHASYPLNSENASPPGTFTVYLSCAEMATPPKTASIAAIVVIISMLLPCIFSLLYQVWRPYLSSLPESHRAG